MATSITAFVGDAGSDALEAPVALTSASDFNRFFMADTPLRLAVHDFFREGGAVAVVAATLAGLRQADIFFNLLVVPGGPAAEVVADAVALAEERRAMCILDPPAAWSSVGLAAAGARSPAFPHTPNAAVYFPRIAQPGPLRGPAGAVAGVLARSDVLRRVWASPAGIEAGLRSVEALDVAVSDTENGVLNPLGVNCLRTFAGAGPVIWGARTTDTTDSDWRYLPVRRMSLYLEHSLERGLHWAASEPNREPLWARIRADAGAFLHELFRGGAFAGTTPRDAYLVKCDRDTTTQADVDRGVVNVVVGFAPLRPAEFVTLTVGVAAGAAGPLDV